MIRRKWSELQHNYVPFNQGSCKAMPHLMLQTWADYCSEPCPVKLAHEETAQWGPRRLTAQWGPGGKRGTGVRMGALTSPKAPGERGAKQQRWDFSTVSLGGLMPLIHPTSGVIPRPRAGPRFRDRISPVDPFHTGSIPNTGRSRILASVWKGYKTGPTRHWPSLHSVRQET